MPLSMCLYFQGECADAFEHYKHVFEAEETCHQLYADGPPEMCDDNSKDLVMHTTIRIGDAILMGSDRTDSHDKPFVLGNNYCVCFQPSSKEEADRRFPLLAAGGEITMPMQETFWGSYYGLCTDRFGIHWMFNCPLTTHVDEV